MVAQVKSPQKEERYEDNDVEDRLGLLVADGFIGGGWGAVGVRPRGALQARCTRSGGVGGVYLDRAVYGAAGLPVVRDQSYSTACRTQASKSPEAFGS